MPSPHTEAQRVFEIADSMDLDSFGELFADHGRVVFGNGAPLVGREAIRTGIRPLFDKLRSLSHALEHVWAVDGYTIVQANVTYHRLDGRAVTCPAATIYHLDSSGRIDDYRVFADLAPLDD
jgi:hypothetical protein